MAESIELVLPVIDEGKCDGCGTCVELCPTGALALVDGKPMVIDPELCAYDGACEEACPRGAIGRPFVVVFDI